MMGNEAVIQQISYAPIRSKLIPPRYLNKAMQRPRLLKTGKDIVHSKVFSMVAPPGFGKSTLLAQLYEQLTKQNPQVKLAWLNLDSDDNDPITMAEYLFGAFNQCDSKLGLRSLEVLRSGALRSLKQIYVALCEDLYQSQEEYILFVDDFHLLENQEVLDLWQWFIESLPDSVHIVIASRKTLKLKLKKLQLNQDVQSLPLDDLQFNEEEIRDFIVKYHHKNISSELLYDIRSKTEGWIGALQMLILSMQSSSSVEEIIRKFSGEHKDIMEYLSEVVLDQLPEDIKQFMLQIAITERFCPSLATELSGAQNSEVLLQDIDARNLFLIPLDTQANWYRFHHLFQEFLQRQALKVLGKEKIEKLYQKASRWFEKAGSEREAIHYALSGKDYTRGAELLSQFAFKLIHNQGDHRSMLHWMKQLPEEYILTFPMIRLGYALSLTFTHDYNRAQSELNKIKAMMSPEAPQAMINIMLPILEMNENAIAVFQDHILVSRNLAKAWLKKWPETDKISQAFLLILEGYCHFFTSSLKEGAQVLKTAAEIFKKENAVYFYSWAWICLAGIYWTHGDLTQAIEVSETMLFSKNIKKNEKNLSLEKFLETMVANVNYERTDFSNAKKLLSDKKIYLYSFSNTDPSIIYYITYIRIFMFHHEWAQAEKFLQEGENWAQEINFSRLQSNLALLKIELYLQTERIHLVQQILDERQWNSPEDLTEEIEDTNAMIENIFARLANSQILLVQKNYEEAAKKLNILAKLLKKIGLRRYLLSAMIQESICLELMGKKKSAASKIKASLQLAAPEGFISIFLENNPEHNQLVYLLLKDLEVKEATQKTQIYQLRNKIMREYEKKDKLQQNQENISLTPSEEFSLRELEILSMLDSSKNNAQIAKSLYISVGTLKWHLHNIYQKLDVKNRSGAILKAKKLEIIP